MLYIKACVASMAGAWFIHIPVRLVSGLYGLNSPNPNRNSKTMKLTCFRQTSLQNHPDNAIWTNTLHPVLYWPAACATSCHL